MKIKSKNSYSIVDKMERQNSLNEIKSMLEEKYADIEDQNINEVMSYFKKIEKDVVRSQILKINLELMGVNLMKYVIFHQKSHGYQEPTARLYSQEVKHKQLL